MKKLTFPLSLSLCLLFLSSVFAAGAVAQLPSLPHTVRGEVKINGNPAPVGTMITARIGDEEVSEFSITNEGLYAIGIGVTPDNQGETARLYVNGIETGAGVVLKSGELETIDLSVSVPGTDVWYYEIAVLVIIVIVLLVTVKRRRR